MVLKATTLAVCATFALVFPLPGFSQDTRGEVIITVRDDTGMELPGAMVTIYYGNAESLFTDFDGTVEFRDLPAPNDYEFNAALVGYGGYDFRVEVSPGEPTEYDVTLEQEPVDE